MPSVIREVLSFSFLFSSEKYKYPGVKYVLTKIDNSLYPIASVASMVAKVIDPSFEASHLKFL